jgi:c(7)-type cytochrome triheme protein
VVEQPEVHSPIPVIDPGLDFSKFKHDNANHSRFPCALCHERKDNSAAPRLPGHQPCSGCHVAQFADNKNAMCTICHTNVDNGDMKGFPTLRSFNAVFQHGKHLRQANCTDCHRPSRGGGRALSIPAGLRAHTACFQCHSPGAKSGDRNIDSCDTCHSPGRPGAPVAEWAKAFESTPFSHKNHRMECTACHTVAAAGIRGNQVGAPVAAMHKAPAKALSCASCHNNKRAFGGDDFSDCTRCHRGSSYKF